MTDGATMTRPDAPVSQATERLVVVVVFDAMELLDAVGPIEVLSAARRAGGHYRMMLASADGQPVMASSGLQLQVDAALTDITDPVDTLLVVGGLTVPDVAAKDKALLAGVGKLARHARRISSVDTGAFILAACGLLRGHTVTTHWALSRQLAEQHPDVFVEPDRIFVPDGDVYTAAGSTAGIDLALALIEADHGSEPARAVAKHMLVFLHRPGGQRQFSAWLEHPVPEGSPLKPIIDDIVAHPGRDHRLPQIARRAAMSERHLSRLFDEYTNTTPARFVERIRIEAAQRLLEGTDMSMSEIVRRCGFGTAETMRRAFDRVLGVPPAAYRQRFRSAHRP